MALPPNARTNDGIVSRYCRAWGSVQRAIGSVLNPRVMTSTRAGSSCEVAMRMLVSVMGAP